MKLPDWDHNMVRWDAWSAFHIGVTKYGRCATVSYSYPQFIMFDTGELLCRAVAPNPDDRGVYAPLNVSIYATNDEQCPNLFTLDGKLLKRAWLDQDRGQQYLLIDHDTKRAVRIDQHNGTDPELLTMPARFRKFMNGAYFPGADLPPVGGAVTVQEPSQTTLTKDQREHIGMIHHTAKTAMELVDHPMSKKRYQYDGYGQADCAKVLAATRWSDLDDETLRQLYFNGVGRLKVMHPYLVIE